MIYYLFTILPRTADILVLTSPDPWGILIARKTQTFNFKTIDAHNRVHLATTLIDHPHHQQNKQQHHHGLKRNSNVVDESSPNKLKANIGSHAKQILLVAPNTILDFQRNSEWTNNEHEPDCYSQMASTEFVIKPLNRRKQAAKELLPVSPCHVRVSRPIRSASTSRSSSSSADVNKELCLPLML